jgi:GNAT superfamily N-acetyltransferase
MTLNTPEPIGDGHVLEGFDCTAPDLTDWLKRRALANHRSGASRTFVVCEAAAVVGYYALAAGAVRRDGAPKSLSRTMPDPIPVVVLARLAVHRDWAGKGIGRGLLKDALLRALRVSEEMGVRAMLCHAMDDAARDFYLHHGFSESPIDRQTLVLSMEQARSALAGV